MLNLLCTVIKALKLLKIVSVLIRPSPPDVFMRKGILKIYHKFTGYQTCGSVILIKLQSNLTEITLRRGCSPISPLQISGTSFPKNTSGGLVVFDQF